MTSVVPFDPDRRAAARISEEARTLVSGGGPPHDGGMEARVAKLEETATEVRERLARIEAKLDSAGEHGATKADILSMTAQVSAMETRMIKWFVGTAVALAAAAFAIARFIG